METHHQTCLQSSLVELQRLERRKAMETIASGISSWTEKTVAAVGTPKGNGESPACVVPSAFSMLQRLERRKAMETSLFRMAATRKFRSGTRLKPKGNGDARSAACFCISAASSGTRLEPKGNGDRSRKTDTDNPSYGRERS